MENYLSKITPQVSDTWRADEVWVKVKGDMKYLFALIDDETRFWIAKEVANSKERHDASSLFKQAKEVQIYHNYIRPHMALDGKTPSEVCGITIRGNDKWKTLIQNAVKSN